MSVDHYKVFYKDDTFDIIKIVTGRNILDSIDNILHVDIICRITCEGCIENQPNQQSHSDYGGCLYAEEN